MTRLAPVNVGVPDDVLVLRVIGRSFRRGGRAVY